MKTVIAAVLLISSINVFASNYCETEATEAAVNAYTTSVESADRDNIVSSAELEISSRLIEKYTVDVASPCTFEGDDSNCAITYTVLVDITGPECVVKSVTEL